MHSGAWHSAAWCAIDAAPLRLSLHSPPSSFLSHCGVALLLVLCPSKPYARRPPLVFAGAAIAPFCLCCHLVPSIPLSSCSHEPPPCLSRLTRCAVLCWGPLGRRRQAIAAADPPIVLLLDTPKIPTKKTLCGAHEPRTNACFLGVPFCPPLPTCSPEYLPPSPPPPPSRPKIQSHSTCTRACLCCSRRPDFPATPAFGPPVLAWFTCPAPSTAPQSACA